MKVTITIELDERDLMNIIKEEEPKEEPKEEKQKDDHSIYARFFDEGCPAWTKDASTNLMTLKFWQNYANDLLKIRGHLFLNEVYDMLGIPRTKEGQVVGWIYNVNNPVGDNFVDFDIFSDRNTDFVNGYELTALLDFNVDGNILEQVNK